MSAHEDRQVYGALLDSVIGVVFLGTPHRGSNIATAGKIAGTIVNILQSAAPKPALYRTDHLSLLQTGSQTLDDLIISSRQRLQGISVTSFYETEPTPIASLGRTIVTTHPMQSEANADNS